MSETLEQDGLLSVAGLSGSSLSCEADELARRHPASCAMARDFYDLSHRYYQKLLAHFYPETLAQRRLEQDRRAQWKRG